MIPELPWGLAPGMAVLLGSLLIPVIPGVMRVFYAAALPLVSLYHLSLFAHGRGGEIGWLGQTLVLARVDELSLVFAWIFHAAAFIAVLYAGAQRSRLELTAGLVYAASAIGAVFAGDLITLFIYWELTALASVFLIWVRGDARAFGAGMRYLIVQVGSGVLLFAGLLAQIRTTGDSEFGALSLDTLAGQLLFAAFGIKAALPLLHNWLVDAYPEASVAGAVFLSAFTTKMAIYAMARGFAGTELLITLGVITVVFTLIYAAIEDDLRRVLAYALVNQLGFMLIGVGIGTELALSGVAAHAVSHVLYKSLLFMAVGAVLLRTGTARASELGGAWRSMPLTMMFCIIGALGMSAPLFAGFASKSLILSAIADTHLTWLWLLALLSSAGVFLVSGVKVVYFAFLGPDTGIRCREAPPAMLAAMGLAATALLGLGLAPQWFYAHLPHPVDYRLYTTEHVVTQLQLLVAVTLGFSVLQRLRLWPRTRGLLLDFDWLYRRGLPRLLGSMQRLGGGTAKSWLSAIQGALGRGLDVLDRHQGQEGLLARTWPTGSMVLWVAVLLAGYLILTFL